MTIILPKGNFQAYDPEGQVVFHKAHNDAAVDVAAAAALEIPVAGAKAVGISLTLANINNRTWTVTIEVSMDGGNTYIVYSMLISNAANTNSQTLLRTASLALTADGTQVAWMTPETLGAITHIRLPITKSDGGSPAGTADVVVAVSR